MPYNPIERPMPFDQILQAGAMKQTAVDNLVLSANEFEAQKQLTGGRSTSKLAQELNNEYSEKAANVSMGLTTGSMNVSQAKAILSDVNRTFNKDPYVKSVLQDESLTPIAAKTEADENFLAGLGISTGWNDETNTWGQIGKDDIDKGFTFDGSRYGLVTQPGFYKDHVQELSNLVSNRYASSHPEGVDFNFESGTVYTKQGQVIETLDGEKIDRLLWNFVSAQPISDSDKRSVKYEMLKAKKEGGEFTAEDYFEKLRQAASTMPFYKVQESENLGRIPGGRGGSSADQEDNMIDAVTGWTGVTTEQGSNIAREYGVRLDNTNGLFTDLSKLLTEEGRTEALNRKLSNVDMVLKPGSSTENPEYIYTDTGNNVGDRSDIQAAERLVEDYNNDMKFFKNLSNGIDRDFKKQYGIGYSEFIDQTITKYNDDIEERIFNVRGLAGKKFKAESESPETFERYKANVEEIIPQLRELRNGKRYNITPNNTNIPYSVLFGEEYSDAIRNADSTTLATLQDAQKKFVKGKLIEMGMSDEDAQTYSTRAKLQDDEFGDGELMPFFPGTAGVNSLENSIYAQTLPLEAVSKMQTIQGNNMKNLLRSTFEDAAVMDILENEPSARNEYTLYKETREEVLNRIQSFNQAKIGYYITPDQNDAHAMLAESVQSSANLRTVKALAGKSYSGDKSGGTLQDVLPKGTTIKDYRLSQVYLDVDESGNQAYYGIMQYYPSGNSQTDAAIATAEEVMKPTDDFPGGRGVIDIKMDELMDGQISSDVKALATTIDTFRSTLYTMDNEQTETLRLPQTYGPSIDVTITKQATGVKMTGNVFVSDNGEIKKMDIMDAYRRELANRGENVQGFELMDDKTAAVYAGKLIQSNAYLADNYSFLYDSNGEFQGADVPDSIEDRKFQIRETLMNSENSLREALPNMFKGDEAEDLERAVNTLMQIMQFETGNKFTPYVTNPDKTAIGLIQFYQSPGTKHSKKIGKKDYSFAELGRMNIAEQIQGPVIEYLSEVGKNKVSTPEELYLAVFMPAFLNYSGEGKDGLDYDSNLFAIADDLINKGTITSKKWNAIQNKNPAFKGKRSINEILNTVRAYNPQ